MSNFTPADQREADILAVLHPAFVEKVQQLLTQARDAGLAVYIFQGLRTMDEQRALYAKGRDANGNVIDKSQVVTNARAGSSYHNFALAVDLVFDGDVNKPGVQWSWNKPQGDWAKLGAIGEAIGLEWAGHWRTFQEMPHFQLKVPGAGVHELLAWYTAGGLDNVFENVNNQLGLNPIS